MLKKFKKAFTLIELLIVIGIMAVIAAGVVALIDPVEKTKQANDANMQTIVGQYATAMQSSAAQDTGGNYPQPVAAPGNSYDVFVNNGELKSAPTVPTSNPAYVMGYAVNASPATVAVFYSSLNAKKHTSKCTAGQGTFWFYATGNGKACGVCTANPTTYPGTGTACGW